jgi:hypothetical protein
MFASFLAGETRPATREVLDAAAREAARGAGLLDAEVRWCATAGFRIVVSEKSLFSQLENQSRVLSPRSTFLTRLFTA